MLMLVIGIAPIISPSVGGWLLQFGGWGSIFWALVGFACICGVAVAVDLPETHPFECRNRDSIVSVFRRYGALLVDFRYMGYAVPVSLALGLIFAYVASSPSLFHAVLQTFTDSLQSGFRQQCRWLDWCCPGEPLAYPPPRYPYDPPGRVDRQCMAAVLLPVLAYTGMGGFLAIYADLFVCLTTVGLILPNATAAVMAPYPHQAGVASALLGMLQFSVGAATGAIVGLLHDGTARPHGLYNGRLHCGFSSGHNSN